MKSGIGVAALAALMAAAAGADASAQLVEIVESPLSQARVGVVGTGLQFLNDETTVTTLPAVGTLYAEVPNISGGMSYSFDQPAFEYEYSSSQEDTGAPLASFNAGADIFFRALVAIRWTLSGSLVYSGTEAEFIGLRGSVRDMTVGVYLTDILIQSVDTGSASLDLATGGGNSVNNLGPVMGELLPGRVYRFSGNAFTINGANFPSTGSSSGGLTLTFEEIPAPGAAAEFAIGGVFVARRRRG